MNKADLKWRPLWQFMGVLIILAIAAFSLVDFGDGESSYIINKGQHLLAYAVLMGWYCQLYRRQTFYQLALVAIGYGLAMEIAQSFTDYRVFEFPDLIANTLGVILAWILCRFGADRILTGLEHLLRR